MRTVDKVNALALSGLYPGLAAFLHRYLWDKIHAVHVSHSKRGLFGADIAIAPNMIIDEIYNDWKTCGRVKNQAQSARLEQTY
jgi:hypothetical protein